ncbi:hypothetical protein AXF42_Ash006681 [Apostasia shenzhenica]|uniref:Armadillo repeat-containing protein 6 n=1 Tax=Apostasia shenzhenica TaxID=1088818 RepID=A0A2I0AIU9_9ASPA|nr:hypothetical protein AXF42_Ash006681 [Apostasia shenzhenica]
MVAENMEDLGMNPDEALQDAIQTLAIQGVDLSGQLLSFLLLPCFIILMRYLILGIVRCIPGVSSTNDHPVNQSLDALRSILSLKDDRKVGGLDETLDEELAELLDKLYDLCRIEGSNNVSIATRNGGVELLVSLCGAIQGRLERSLVSALMVLSSIVHDLQSTESFRQGGGPKIVMNILKGSCKTVAILHGGFSVISAAATGNEVLKEAFMELKVDELILQILREKVKNCPQSLYDAICVLLMPDDNRVVASQVYGYARRFAKIGIADALVEALNDDLNSSSLVSACIALKAVTVNAMVAENMEDLGMNPDEALQDAIQTLAIQGVDLSGQLLSFLLLPCFIILMRYLILGIVRCIPGVSSTNDHPVNQSLDALRSILSLKDDRKVGGLDETLDEELAELLDKLYDLCRIEGSNNVSIATRNGGVELLVSLCGAIQGRLERSLVSALMVLSSIVHDLQSTESFRQGGGPKIVMNILKGSCKTVAILHGGFSVISAAATGNEVLKEAFMELKVDELILQILREKVKNCPQSLYDAICVLLMPDDNRVVASQVYGYARRFAKIGIADALVEALNDDLNSSSLVSACIALKAVTVNDEICRSVAGSGGIDIILKYMDDGNKGGSDRAVIKACCSLLAKIMSIITTLSLRSPENAALAVEAGAGNLAILAMQKFPAAHQMQRQSCFMIRNLVARSPENRTILLNAGIEKLIRRAKGSHGSCKDAATAALRDLGLDDYDK